MKTYLGDGAYAEWDGLALTLTAENGIRATDRVVLEPEHIIALLAFLHAQHVESTPLLDLLMGRTRR